MGVRMEVKGSEAYNQSCGWNCYDIPKNLEAF